MSDGSLSQDEIDALLQGGEGGGEDLGAQALSAVGAEEPTFDAFKTDTRRNCRRAVFKLVGPYGR